MRAICEEALVLIKHYEGFSPRIYVCPAGYETIGYGHLVRAGEDFSAGISEAQAEALLRADVSAAQSAVLRYINVPLRDGQYGALVSFTFNLGAGALQRSSLRRKVNRGAHGDVPAELMRWVWAGGVRLSGLVRRREAEGALYVS